MPHSCADIKEFVYLLLKTDYTRFIVSNYYPKNSWSRKSKIDMMSVSVPEIELKTDREYFSRQHVKTLSIL